MQQDLTRLGINSIALLNRTVSKAPDVMGKLRDLLHREADRHDRWWMETVQWLTVTERTEKRQVTISSRDVERDCRSIVNQLVNSMPKELLLRTSFTERGKSTQVQATEEVRVKSKSSFTRKVQFTDARDELELSLNCSSGDKTLSGEDDEPVQDFRACTGRLVRGDNVGTTKGQNVVRGAGFKATKGQSFFRGGEKYHRQIGT